MYKRKCTTYQLVEHTQHNHSPATLIPCRSSDFANLQNLRAIPWNRNRILEVELESIANDKYCAVLQGCGRKRKTFPSQILSLNFYSGLFSFSHMKWFEFQTKFHFIPFLSLEVCRAKSNIVLIPIFYFTKKKKTFPQPTLIFFNILQI